MIKKSFLLLMLATPLFYQALPVSVVQQSVPVQQEIAAPFFAELSELYPSQLRYSSRNVEQKIAEMKQAGDLVWDEKKQEWTLCYDQGKSGLPLKEAVPVIKTRIGYVLADGHHHALASLKLNAKTLPVIVIADLSALNGEEFWKEAEKNGWAYPYTIQGKKAPPPLLFTELQDDPNRYFAALIARKCRADGDMKNSIGAEYPVWIKVGKDIPFVEFRIADVLWNKGIVYDYKMGDAPPQELVEKARAALVEAKIDRLKVVSERTLYSSAFAS